MCLLDDRTSQCDNVCQLDDRTSQCDNVCWLDDRTSQCDNVCQLDDRTSQCGDAVAAVCNGISFPFHSVSVCVSVCVSVYVSVRRERCTRWMAIPGSTTCTVQR